MDIESITVAYNSLKAGKDILSSLLDAKIEAESRKKVSDVLSKLGSTQDTLFELREELFKLQAGNEELRRKLTQFENWDDQLQQYSLTKTPGGAFVYASNNEPHHFICPSCVAQQQIQILQDNRTQSGKYRCP